MPPKERRLCLDGWGKLTQSTIGYPAICAPSQGGRVCGPSVGKPALYLSDIYNLGSPQETLQYALELQTAISVAIPAMSALLFLFAIISLVAAPSIIKCNGTNNCFYISLIKFLFWSSTASAFAAAYALTSSGAALSVQSRYPDMQNSGIDIEPGNVMLALQWTTWVFTLAAACMSGSFTRKFLREDS
ncbi:hypothetical protein NHQ30_003683 [Ciborinia camelliae]|nr:hypothetical protein NHQ30_003683 [Ciborinia camelliae]